MSQQFGLGRGLSSLIPSKQPAQASSQTFQNAEEFSKRTVSAGDESIRGDNFVMEVDVSLIVANPHQPRNLFDDEKLENLAQSIKMHGIIQPLIVSKKGNLYELIAGERRFQASKIVGLKKVPVIIREASELQKLELAIIENIQRHDLNAIEEGRAYQKLADEYQMNQEEVAAKMGKSRSLVANKIRLLNLPIEVQKGLIDGKITEGHAKTILSLDNPEKQRALYELILKSNLTVRQAEEKTKEVSVKSYNRSKSIDPEVKKLEEELVGMLGTKVRVNKSGDGGKIVIEYYSREDLDSLLEKMSHSQ
ncbi:MAG: Chromosome (Plasmid) partitioning protein ParB / Stage 0 sporulation protein J [Candidatus Moranbacteria bacterium GW2011_GWC2_37_73]|nr:MAG: stage 0 sporulation protein J, chromosome partitioning protein, ParB family [Parcubacteria group bacterium GW2011_GWC1_36_108]KKQ00363.1 MAG: Chromosome (Plasmid) partitioning protein ParB / Stage 0 sporulation protein J [Candidatus Moranbacteria bacterium GW2011_GWD1_36_198]KKQ39530.1 MAG: Chromosome (Plasmid) partitioning protein ParB / Stage 0 sporulation protein J [Candidatus Moranbacteria bacterium GW2011_GWC2_37_73]HAR99740.1 chromosome partitioning protein ParB [Candidatus Moranba